METSFRDREGSLLRQSQRAQREPRIDDLGSSSAGMLKIGAAAREAGLSVPSVRFYESEGLLGEAPRTDGGYRLYGAADIRRLKLIRRARTLGLSLPDVRELVRAAFEESCRSFEPRLKQAIDGRVVDVRRQIEELTLLHAQLTELQSHLAGDCACDHPAGECSGCSLLGEAADGTSGCTCATNGAGSRSEP